MSLGVASIEPLVLTPTGTLTVSGTLVNHGSAALVERQHPAALSKTPGREPQPARCPRRHDGTAARRHGPGRRCCPRRRAAGGVAGLDDHDVGRVARAVGAGGLPDRGRGHRRGPGHRRPDPFGTARTFLRGTCAGAADPRRPSCGRSCGSRRAPRRRLLRHERPGQPPGGSTDVLDAAGAPPHLAGRRRHPRERRGAAHPSRRPPVAERHTGSTAAPTPEGSRRRPDEAAPGWRVRHEAAAARSWPAVRRPGPGRRTSWLGVRPRHRWACRHARSSRGARRRHRRRRRCGLAGRRDRRQRHAGCPRASQGSTAVLPTPTRPPRPVTTYTPSGVGPLTGSTMTAVTSDAVLSNLLATPAAAQGGPALGPAAAARGAGDGDGRAPVGTAVHRHRAAPRAGPRTPPTCARRSTPSARCPGSSRSTLAEPARRRRGRAGARAPDLPQGGARPRGLRRSSSTAYAPGSSALDDLLSRRGDPDGAAQHLRTRAPAVGVDGVAHGADAGHHLRARRRRRGQRQGRGRACRRGRRR